MLRINIVLHQNIAQQIANVVHHLDTEISAQQVRLGAQYFIQITLVFAGNDRQRGTSTLGTYQFHMWDDDWTAVTADGKRTAQFEHTILVTETGCEVLTGGDKAVSPRKP